MVDFNISRGITLKIWKMQLDKRLIYVVIGYFVLSIGLSITKLVVSLQPDKNVMSAQNSFNLIQSRLDNMENELVLKQSILDAKLDSFNNIQLELNTNLVKYNYDLSKSIKRLKQFKDEIIPVNYHDSSTISVVNRLNGTK